ncbi:MAG: hypothetical protein K6D02_02195 [Lachnospiraceae bacterium]|nr:hypothetical protein [Lachnospiraceae bacterium]
MKKYELTDKTKEYKGHTLYQIKRLLDGKLGGWIESENNLSQDGTCWVNANVCVYGNAKIYDDALIGGNAKIYDNAIITDNAFIYGNAEVRGNAKIFDNAEIYDSANISGNVIICDNAEVYNKAEITDNVQIYDNAKIYGNAQIHDNAHIYDDAEIYGNARIHNNAIICGDAKVFDNAEIFNDVNIYGNAKIFENAFVCRDAIICENAEIYGNVKIYDDVKVCGEAQVCGKAEAYGDAIIHGAALVHGNAVIGSGAEIFGDAKINCGHIDYDVTTDLEQYRADICDNQRVKVKWDVDFESIFEACEKKARVIYKDILKIENYNDLSENERYDIINDLYKNNSLSEKIKDFIGIPDYVDIPPSIVNYAIEGGDDRCINDYLTKEYRISEYTLSPELEMAINERSHTNDLE